MTLKIYLTASWLIIIAITWYAITTLGINFLPWFFGDMLNHGWRMQFNVDFAIHLILFANWVLWREGFNQRGIICTALVFLGGLFTLPYLLHRLYKANGDIRLLLLGRHA
ncbi:MAG: hypothetical protein ACPGSM_15260 [Thiolinea sp.]